MLQSAGARGGGGGGGGGGDKYVMADEYHRGGHQHDGFSRWIPPACSSVRFQYWALYNQKYLQDMARPS